MYKLDRVLAAALLLFAAGCGGGGGDDVGGVLDEPPPLTDFQGAYQVVGVIGQTQLMPNTLANYGTALPDGAGVLDLNLTTNTGDSIGVNNAPLAYDIEPDGDLLMTAVGAPLHEGSISFDGDAAIVGTGDAFPEPGIMMFLQKPVVFEPLLLTGPYHTISFVRNVQLDTHMGIVRSALFDPNGTVAFAAGNANINGSSNPTSPIDLTYTIQPDGTMGITFGANSQTIGTINASGDFAIMGGTVPGGTPRIDAMVRASTNADVSLIQGLYHVVSYTAETNGFTSRTGRINFDGTGNGLATMKRKSGNSPALGEVDPVAYTVTAEGRVAAIYQNRGQALEGAMSPDGRFVILGGAAVGRPVFEILIRKEPLQN